MRRQALIKRTKTVVPKYGDGAFIYLYSNFTLLYFSGDKFSPDGWDVGMES